jgi:hypothetical protein
MWGDANGRYVCSTDSMRTLLALSIHLPVYVVVWASCSPICAVGAGSSLGGLQHPHDVMETRKCTDDRFCRIYCKLALPMPCADIVCRQWEHGMRRKGHPLCDRHGHRCTLNSTPLYLNVMQVLCKLSQAVQLMQDRTVITFVDSWCLLVPTSACRPAQASKLQLDC